MVEQRITPALQVKQFRYGTDNFSYLIFNDQEGMVIDGGAVDGIFSFLQQQGLRLTLITNTHAHGDHTAGNRRLLDLTGAYFQNSLPAADQSPLAFGGENIRVYRTPGHSSDSVCFHLGNVLISGDTLFNGTVGNCFSGDMRGFFKSLKKLCTLPDSTVIYAGHDYVRESVAFARRIEPHNPMLDQYLLRYTPEHVFSTLAEERQVNPYLRFNQPHIISMLEARSLPVTTDFERWRSLMSIE
jgi:hydroxyacylglutathione hydrolase